MKKKFSLVIVAGLVCATPAWCLFGEDVAALIQLVTQGRQLYSLSQQAKQNVEDGLAFIKNPGGFRGVMTKAADVLGEASDYSTNQQVRRISQALQVSRNAISQIGSDRMSAESMLMTADVTLRSVEMQEKLDGQQVRATYEAEAEQYSQERGGFGCVSCSVGGHSR